MGFADPDQGAFRRRGVDAHGALLEDHCAWKASYS